MGAKYYAKLTLVLFVITAVVAALLGAVNAVTETKIIEANKAKTVTALKVVMPGASSFEEIGYKGKDALVKELYVAKSGSAPSGYVVKVSPTGFGGEISMVVGVSTAGKITGVSIITMAETPGLGTNAANDSFLKQFAGISSTQAVKKDGGKIDALTGATITSRAVTKGVNSALEAVKTIG
jgi:electron transport complex protein RnfG